MYYAVVTFGCSNISRPSFHRSLAAAQKIARAIREEGRATNVRIAQFDTRAEAIDADISTATNIVE